MTSASLGSVCPLSSSPPSVISVSSPLSSPGTLLSSSRVSSSTSLSSTVKPSSYHTVLAMMNIEKFIDDSDVRHQKLLQNIVKILKINDLLEEYRLVVGKLQANCSCKKNKSSWEQVSLLETKYKELILESCRGNSSINQNTETEQCRTLQNNLKEMVTIKSSSGSSPGLAVSSSAAAASGAGTGNLTFTIFNSNIKSEPNHLDDISCKKILVPCSNNNKLLSTKQCDSNTISIQSVGVTGVNSTSMFHNNKSKNDPIYSHHHGGSRKVYPKNNSRNREISVINLINNNGNMQIGGNQFDSDEEDDEEEFEQHGNSGEQQHDDDNDDINLIEEEDILEDEEDDAEEELDIEEYMALSEILEKESAQNKFEKEPDSKNEFILAIRDMSTKDVICYECIVGGTCGFLSRERQRMLLHISKHFQAGNQQQFDDQMSNDSDRQIVSTTGSSSCGGPVSQSTSVKGIDISIIPLHRGGVTNINNSDEPKFSMFKEEHGIGSNKFTNNNKSLTTRVGGSISTPCSVSVKSLANNIVNKQTVMGGLKSGDKPIRCLWDSCTFMCDQNYKLRTHIRQVHEKVRPYLCDWPGCFGAYKTRSNLASHRMVHTGERPYICDYPKCGAKFARKYDCERHRRIHSEKMFACEWPGCGKRLCDPYNLERHMMVHKGELPFRCPISNCFRGFRELRYLRDHMVNTHKFLPDTSQLRAACLSSAKMSSISGYNLNDSSCSETGPMSENGNHEILESLVNKIVSSHTSNGASNRAARSSSGQQQQSRQRQSTSSSTVNEDDDGDDEDEEEEHGSDVDDDSCSTIENEVYLEEQPAGQQQQDQSDHVDDAKPDQMISNEQNGDGPEEQQQDDHHDEDEGPDRDENNNNRRQEDVEILKDDHIEDPSQPNVEPQQNHPDDDDDDEILVIKKVGSQPITTTTNKRANLRSSLQVSTRSKRTRRY